MPSAAEELLFADIERLDIAFSLVEHEPVFTVEESLRLDRDIPGAHTKNLFLKDSGERFWLVTVPAHMRVDLKALAEAIGSKRLSFGKADDMDLLLGISPGSVTPLAVINDIGQMVTVVIEAGFFDSRQINIHPLRNDATIGMSPEDLRKLLTFWNHVPLVISVPAIG